MIRTKPSGFPTDNSAPGMNFKKMIRVLKGGRKRKQAVPNRN